MRVLVFALLATGSVLAQPVAASYAIGPAIPGVEPLAVRVVAAPDGWEAPPALYWTGVGLDAVVLAGGAYVLVQGLRLLDAANDERAGLGAPVLALAGVLGVSVGGVMAGFALYDGVRVVGGDDPALARLFDPTRRPTSGPVPPYPFPEPPRRPDL